MPDATDYTTGPSTYQKPRAAFEFKAPDQGSGGRGGGYPRWRSYEWRPHTPRQTKEDVYVPVHRLAAVAWLFPDDWTAADVLDSEHLVGADVHHELGHPAATIEDELTLCEHGTHSAITQAEKRAFAADRQRTIEDGPAPERCPRCDDVLEDGGVTATNLSGSWCLDCVTDHPDRGTIQL